MTDRLPVVAGKTVVAVLENLGFARVSQRGSHVKLRRSGRTVIVPLHDELARGTLRSVLRQADVTPEQFVEAVRGR